MKKCSRFILFILFSSVFISTSSAQRINFKSGKVLSKNYFEELSFKFEKNKIIIPVEIKGKTYRFLLDTGAPNIISKEVYESIQPKNNRTLSTSDANAITQKLEFVTLEKVKLGAVEFQGFSALVFDLNGNEIFKCFNIDGFIGSNMLRHSIIQIDTKQQKIKLTDKAKYLGLNKENSQKIKFADNQYGPYIWVDLRREENVREMVLIDTGMGSLYDISKNNYNIIKTKHIYNSIGNSDGASSLSLFGEVPISNHTRVHLPKLIINGFQINNVITHTSNGDHSKMGAELLNHGVMTLDYKNKRFYFNSYEESLDLEGDFGFTQTLKDNKLVVGYVWDKDLKAKINYGDEILEVNGKAIVSDDFCDYITKTSHFKTSDSLLLKVKTDENTVINLKVKKKPLSLILDNNN
ncbi:aspartyl protease family protein [Psychroserpens sp. S379A]|uniref:retropepsin-like aspartic protease n=1 Tax=Psychroserpens sp. S379A TaxID=3415137 RepID=UPI003C7DCF63